MSEEDRSREMEGLKAKINELRGRVRTVLEDIQQEGARLHDRISEVLGTPKGGEEKEEGEE